MLGAMLGEDQVVYKVIKNINTDFCFILHYFILEVKVLVTIILKFYIIENLMVNWQCEYFKVLHVELNLTIW